MSLLSIKSLLCAGAAALSLLAASATAGPLSGKGQSMASALAPASATPLAGVITNYVFDVAGILSFDELGSPLNVVRTLNVGTNARVIGIGWDVTLFADAPSFLSELTVGFGSSSVPVSVNLRPGVEDDNPGTASYSSGGVVDLIGLSLEFSVDANGILRLEFFEGFDDFPLEFDGEWLRGALTIRVEGTATPVSAPSTAALLAVALAGLALTRRRRSA